MKKLFLLIAIVITLSSCRTLFDQTLLHPTEGSISPLLPRLELQKSVEELKYAQGNQITSNSKMYTLFEREMENICQERGDVKGYIEPIITINEVSPGYGFYYLSALTFLVPNLFGMPISAITYQLEVEFKISDLNEYKVWKKTYYQKKKIYYGLYYNWNKRGDEVILGLYRQMIQDFKKDLQADREQVVHDLELNE